MPNPSAKALLRELTSHPKISEAVALSTCNRTELYAVTGNPAEVESLLVARLARRAGIDPAELPVYALRERDAARHLYRVTGGLESMTIGESEVQGQVKRAYKLALAARTTGPLTNQLFRAALTTGKRVRSETQIGAGHASMATVAVDAARAALGDLAGRRVLIMGAGETAELTAQAFHAENVATICVASRRRESALALAPRVGGEAATLDALPEELERADVVIGSTSSPHAIVTAEILARRRGRPVLLIDLAVPRDFDPECAALEGVTLLDMDALQATVERHLTVRRAEAERAEAIVEEEIQTFARWLDGQDVVPTLTALRTHARGVVNGLLAENEGRWESLSERDRGRVEALATAVVKRLLHAPTQRIRALEPKDRHPRLQLLRELFALEEPPAASEPPPAEVRRR